MDHQKSFIMLPDVESLEQVNTKITDCEQFAKLCFPKLNVAGPLLKEVLRMLECEEDFFEKTVPHFQSLFKKKLFAENKVQLLLYDETVEFSKEQAAALLGMCFFGILDDKIKYPEGVGFNVFTFRLLFQPLLLSPLICIVHYLNRVAKGACGDRPIRLRRFVLPSNMKTDNKLKVCNVKVSFKVSKTYGGKEGKKIIFFALC